jgi:mRNA (2'-O-methyladenosine-N6-)-methyltransferase
MRRRIRERLEALTGEYARATATIGAIESAAKRRERGQEREDATAEQTAEQALQRRTTRETQRTEERTERRRRRKGDTDTGTDDITEYCTHCTREDCQRANTATTAKPCTKVHFRRVIAAHTDPALGDCSYLDTCRHEHCKYAHYELDTTGAILATAATMSPPP